jgi:cytochrome b561
MCIKRRSSLFDSHYRKERKATAMSHEALNRYHPALVLLHWLLAVLVLFSLAMGLVWLSRMPNDAPLKIFALRGHMAAGIAILALMVVRFAVRLGTRRPPRATTGNRVLDRLSLFVHYLMYALVALMAISGIELALLAGLPDIVFGGSGAPLPATFTQYPPRVAHGIVAWLLLTVIALHIMAALYHQFVRRDRLLGRMAFGGVSKHP